VGKRYLSSFIEKLKPTFKTIHLEVEASNAAALAVYESTKFSSCGLRKSYYGPGKDAYNLSRSI
jgi:ribosomal protein S18 acetylase RimI-like enzyme